jgi:hypothetical protein
VAEADSDEARDQAIHELEVFLRQDQAEMEAEYRRIYKRTSEDPGTAGDEGEENWAALLREWLPSRYQVVTKGRIVFPDRSASAQVDVVVLRASYPQRLLNKKLYLSSGVVAAFECKNTLTAAHVREAARTAAAIKTCIARTPGTLQCELRLPLVYGLLAHSHSWKAETSTPTENVDGALLEGLTGIEHPSAFIDIICVADLAAWTLSHFIECPWFYEPKVRELRTEVGVPADGWVQSQYTRFTDGVFAADARTPNPLAILITHLLQWAGWDDVDVRPIADYFRIAGLMGSGTGPSIPWPLTIFTDEVHARLKVQPPSTGSFWDSWSMFV